MQLRALADSCDFVSLGTQIWSWYKSDGAEHWENDPPLRMVDEQLHFCSHRDDSEDTEAHWYTYRFGPFTSDGDTTFRFPVQDLPELHTIRFKRMGLQALYQVIQDEKGDFIGEDRVLIHHHDIYDRNSDAPWSFALPASGMPISESTAQAIERWAQSPGGKWSGGVYQPATLQPGTRGEHWGVRRDSPADDCSFCYFQDLGAGYGKILTKPNGGGPFLHDGYLIDKRPAHSPALTYTYTIGLKLVDLSSPGIRALSEHQMWNAANVKATLSSFDQSLFYVFSGADSYFYYTGRWPYAGTLHGIGTYLHEHELHQLTYLTAATPDEVGLDDPALSLDDFCLPKLTSDTRMRTNDGLRAELHAACPKCFDSEVDGKLICKAMKGKTDCKDWHFESGDPFTSLSFFGAPRKVEAPEAQHIVWFMR